MRGCFSRGKNGVVKSTSLQPQCGTNYPIEVNSCQSWYFIVRSSAHHKMHRKNACNKCGSKDFGLWTSAGTGRTHRYCRKCRRNRATSYTQRMKRNGGHHNRKEWLEKLATYDKCPGCQKLWKNIRRRPNRRYKHVWTKDHIKPITLGGTNNI